MYSQKVRKIKTRYRHKHPHTQACLGRLIMNTFYLTSILRLHRTKIIFCFFLLPLLLDAHQASAISRELYNYNFYSYFNLNLNDLKNITVYSADRRDQKIREIPASVLILDREEITRHGYSSFQDLLRNISGIYNIDSHFGQPGNFGVRGLWKDGENNQNLLIMINGVKTHDLTIPVEAIDRIEVVRGPISTMYGMNAFFGSINVITNATQKENISLLSSATSVDGSPTQKDFLRYSTRGEHTATVINAMIRHSDGPQMRVGEITDPSRLSGVIADSVQTAGLSRREQLGIDEAFFQLASELDQLALDFKYARHEVGIDFISPSLGDEGSTQKQDNLRFASKFESDLNSTTTINLQGSYTFTNRHLEFVNKGIDNRAFQNLSARDFELDGRLFWTPVDINMVVSSGLYLSRYHEDRFSDTMSPGLMNQKNIMTPKESWGVFSQANYSFDNFILVGGLRLQQILPYQRIFKRNTGSDFWNDYFGPEYGTLPFSDYEFTINYSENKKIYAIPRLALIYAPGDTHAFKWIYGKGMQDNEFPHAEELETLEFSYSLSGSRLYSHVNVFHNRFSNLLLISPTLLENGSYQVNYSFEDEKTSNGTEFLIKMEASPSLSFEFSLTWQETRNSAMPGKVAYSPDLLGYLKGSWHSARYSAAINATWVDDMVTYGNGLGGRIGDNQPAYSLVDINLRASRVFDTGMFASFRLENIFDTGWRHPTTPDNAWANRGYLGAGRLALVQIGYEF